MRVAGLFRSRLPSQHRRQGRLALHQLLQAGLQGVEVFELVHALGAPAQFARSLWPAQQQNAQHGGLAAQKVEHLLQTVLVLGDAAVGARVPGRPD